MARVTLEFKNLPLFQEMTQPKGQAMMMMTMMMMMMMVMTTAMMMLMMVMMMMMMMMMVMVMVMWNPEHGIHELHRRNDNDPVTH
jgi:hypothetical protein